MRWIDAYEKAWRSPGTDQLAMVFAPEVTYRTSPWAEPVKGPRRTGPVLWEHERAGPDEQLHHGERGRGGGGAGRRWCGCRSGLRGPRPWAGGVTSGVAVRPPAGAAPCSRNGPSPPASTTRRSWRLTFNRGGQKSTPDSSGTVRSAFFRGPSNQLGCGWLWRRGVARAGFDHAPTCEPPPPRPRRPTSRGPCRAKIGGAEGGGFEHGGDLHRPAAGVGQGGHERGVGRHAPVGAQGGDGKPGVGLGRLEQVGAPMGDALEHGSHHLGPARPR